MFRFEDQGFRSSKPASPPDAAGRLILPYPGGGAMTTIQVQPLTRKFPIVTLFVSGNPPVRRCFSTTLVHCQGPGELSIAEDQLVFLFAKDRDESLIAAPRI